MYISLRRSSHDACTVSYDHQQSSKINKLSCKFRLQISWSKSIANVTLSRPLLKWLIVTTLSVILELFVFFLQRKVLLTEQNWLFRLALSYPRDSVCSFFSFFFLFKWAVICGHYLVRGMGGTRFRKVWPKKCGPPAVSMSEKFPSPQICVKKKTVFCTLLILMCLLSK